MVYDLAEIDSGDMPSREVVCFLRGPRGFPVSDSGA
jgi:hypothetical protein